MNRIFIFIVLLLLTLLAMSLGKAPSNRPPPQSEFGVVLRTERPATPRSWEEPTLVSPPLAVKLVQLTDDPGEDRGPSWDKDYIYFASNRLKAWNLWSIDLPKSETRESSSFPEHKWQPALSRDGDLAFVSDIYGDEPGEELNIWVRLGGMYQPITGQEGDEQWPSWSPDGEWLVFSSDRTGNWDLFMIRSDGTGLKQLTFTPYNERYPAFSPDGQWIAYSSDQSGNDDLWMMRVDGSVLQRITNDPDSEVEPSWSPDGSKIAFASDRTGHWDIWLIDPESTLLTPITDDEAEDRDPAWSLNGEMIAFDSNRSGNWDIWKAEILPGELTYRIAFTRGKDAEQEIYLIDADGFNEFQLTRNQVWDGEPAWSPSGTRLAFVRAIPKREYATHEVGYVARDELWVINADGSRPRLLLNRELYQQAEHLWEEDRSWIPGGLVNLQWTPDESRLFAEGIAWVTSNAIYSVNLDGSRPQLFDGGIDLRMTAKGNLYYYYHRYYPLTEPPPARNEHHLMDRDGHIVRSFAELHDFYPTISSDETKLIYFTYESKERGSEEGVYLLNLKTGEKSKLAEKRRQMGFRSSPEAEYYDRWVEWSPDSQKIVYVSDREGNREIYLMDLEERQEYHLTDNNAADYSPRWSPDGKQIAFVSERDGNPEIYVLVMGDYGPYEIRLTNYPEPDLDPKWSPKPVPKLLGFAAWPVYRNYKYGESCNFTVQYPPDWQPGPEPFNHDGRHFTSPDGEAQVTVYVTNLVLDGSNPAGLQTLDEFITATIQYLSEDRVAFKLLGQRKALLDGHAGRELLYSYTGRESKQRMKARAIYALGLHNGVGIALTAPEKPFEKYNEILEQMLDTYRLTFEDEPH